MQQHGSKCFATQTPPPLSPTHLGDGVKGQISTLSEHGHCVYQIKKNHECNNMVANIFPTDSTTPTHPGDAVNR